MYDRDWLTRIQLREEDKFKFKIIVQQETEYYNHIIAALNPAMRSMYPSFKKLNEDLYGSVAFHLTDLNQSEDRLPMGFKNLDAQQRLLLATANHPCGLLPRVRHNMAIDILKQLKQQADELHRPGPVIRNPDNQAIEEMAHEFAIPTLVPHDPNSKRHFQLPRSEVKTRFFDKNQKKYLAIKIPYFETPVVTFNPSLKWNYLILREDLDQNYTLELTNTPHLYLVKRKDPYPHKKKTKIGV